MHFRTIISVKQQFDKRWDKVSDQSLPMENILLLGGASSEAPEDIVGFRSLDRLPRYPEQVENKCTRRSCLVSPHLQVPP